MSAADRSHDGLAAAVIHWHWSGGPPTVSSMMPLHARRSISAHLRGASRPSGNGTYRSVDTAQIAWASSSLDEPLSAAGSRTGPSALDVSRYRSGSAGATMLCTSAGEPRWLCVAELRVLFGVSEMSDAAGPTLGIWIAVRHALRRSVGG